ncbi:MAG: hypothetical protein Q8K86_11470 [Candidatus Nanopelagicaceae bacterium]|nr:hypothetical protein [Candidatus Nanopelagicaceae bacterium]
MLEEVTIKTQQSKTIWVIVFNQPRIYRPVFNISVFVASSVYMIDSEKLYNLFPATSTFSAVMLYDFVFIRSSEFFHTQHGFCSTGVAEHGGTEFLSTLTKTEAFTMTLESFYTQPF